MVMLRGYSILCLGRQHYRPPRPAIHIHMICTLPLPSLSPTTTMSKPATLPSSRLSQLSSHLSPPAPKDWSDHLTQLTTLQTIAQTPPLASPGYIRQKTRGKLWVRERLAALLDADSFLEIGALTGTVVWDAQTVVGFTPSNNVQGSGTIDGRRVLVTADDFSVRAGHADGGLMEKTVRGGGGLFSSFSR